jgi:hypothetical protein
VQEINRRRLLRAGAILSLAALAAIFVFHNYLDITSYNEYCRDERGSDLPYNSAETFKFVAIGFGILAFPCLIVRESFSLKTYASVSTAMVAISIITLFDALGPPLECFTSGGSRPERDLDFIFPLGIILILIVFYIAFAVDIAVSIGRGITQDNKSD